MAKVGQRADASAWVGLRDGGPLARRSAGVAVHQEPKTFFSRPFIFSVSVTR
jgi:hypothetical protein